MDAPAAGPAGRPTGTQTPPRFCIRRADADRRATTRSTRLRAGVAVRAPHTPRPRPRASLGRRGRRTFSPASASSAPGSSSPRAADRVVLHDVVAAPPGRLAPALAMMATCLAVAKVRDSARLLLAPVGGGRAVDPLRLRLRRDRSRDRRVSGKATASARPARPRVAHERKPVRCQSVLMNPSGPTSPPAPSPSPSNSTPSSRATSTCSSRPTSR